MRSRAGCATPAASSRGKLRAAAMDPTRPSLPARKKRRDFRRELDPLAIAEDYAEANAWHSLWMTGAHDPDGLAEVMGGAAPDRQARDFFELAKDDRDNADESARTSRARTTGTQRADINAVRVRPARSARPDQRWARWVADTTTPTVPRASPNDDGGTSARVRAATLACTRSRQRSWIVRARSRRPGCASAGASW